MTQTGSGLLERVSAREAGGRRPRASLIKTQYEVDMSKPITK